MNFGKKIGETALDLVKDEKIQNKAADLLGMLFPYAGIEKKAVDMYIEEIEKSDLSTEAKMILLLNAKKTVKKLKNQKNVAEIAINNAKEGTDFSEESGVNEEWFDRFMESASFVSDEQMQLVWGKILANEFETPGTMPPNMLRILSEFTQEYAMAFRSLCSMRMLLLAISEDEKVMEGRWRNVIIFEKNVEYMNKIGLSFEMLNELETLGVIKFDALAGYSAIGIKYDKVLVYINGTVIETSSHPDDKFPIGNVIFTDAGGALRKITEPYELEGYVDIVKNYLKTNRVSVEEESSYDVKVSGNNFEVIKK